MNRTAGRRRAGQLVSRSDSGANRLGGRRGVPSVVAWVDRSRAIRRRPGGDEIDHAEVLEAVARSLRGGQSLAVALAEAAEGGVGRPAGAALARSLRRLEAGAGVAVVIDDWVQAGVGPVPSPVTTAGHARVVAGAALALGAELGGAQARSLDAAAASLRDRASLEREVRALGAQARASAAVLVLAPLAFAAFSWATDPRVAQVLVASPLGWACVGLGLALDAAGASWMGRLARSVA